jgi:hypothetical protein
MKTVRSLILVMVDSRDLPIAAAEHVSCHLHCLAPALELLSTRLCHAQLVYKSSPLFAAGEIDRAALAQLVFADAAARRRLNAATHAPVAAELLRQLMWYWLGFRRLVVSQQQQQQR